MSYAQQYSQSKPPCFADPRVFDEATVECKSCLVRGTCKYQVDQKKSNTGRTWEVRTPQAAYAAPPGYTQHPSVQPGPTPQSVPTAISSVVAPVPDIRRVEPVPEASFMGVLVVNGVLNAFTSFMQEGVYALFSIPRQKYPNPFAPPKREVPPPKP